MKIDIAVPTLQYTAPVSAPQTGLPSTTVTQIAPQGGSPFGPAAVLNISAEGRAAYEASITGDMNGDGNTSGVARMEGPEECQTCKSRKYVDVSGDPSVSFQAPTSLSPGEAMHAVPAHEREHVRNEQAKADSEGRRVVSQSVTIHTSVCPECGVVYVSGGETRTVTVSDEKQDEQNDQGREQDQYRSIDLYA